MSVRKKKTNTLTITCWLLCTEAYCTIYLFCSAYFCSSPQVTIYPSLCMLNDVWQNDKAILWKFPTWKQWRVLINSSKNNVWPAHNLFICTKAKQQKIGGKNLVFWMRPSKIGANLSGDYNRVSEGNRPHYSKAQKAREDISFQATLLRNGEKDTAGRHRINYPENHTAHSLLLSLCPVTMMWRLEI